MFHLARQRYAPEAMLDSMYTVSDTSFVTQSIDQVTFPAFTCTQAHTDSSCADPNSTDRLNHTDCSRTGVPVYFPAAQCGWPHA